MLGVTVMLAIAGPGVMRNDPLAVDLDASFWPPSARFWLGSDELGRDLLTRCVYGVRLSLVAAIVVTNTAVGAGLIIGGVAGYVGGRVDNVLMRITDMFLAFPALVLALAIAAALGPSLNNAVLAVAVVWWPWYARLIRGQVLGVKATAYIEASFATGATPSRIILRHMLPNVMAPYLIMLTSFLGQAILLEASLSFLGLGVQEPTAAWGLMLRGAAVEFAEQAPWMGLFPGLAISLAVFAFNLFGDSLRDALDPKLRTL